MMNPITLDDWVIYLDSLDDPTLMRKTKALNSMDGIKSLQESGLTADDIEEILTTLAFMFEERGLAIPKRYDGQYVELESLLRV